MKNSTGGWREGGGWSHSQSIQDCSFGAACKKIKMVNSMEVIENSFEEKKFGSNTMTNVKAVDFYHRYLREMVYICDFYSPIRPKYKDQIYSAK